MAFAARERVGAGRVEGADLKLCVSKQSIFTAGIGLGALTKNDDDNFDADGWRVV